MAELLSQISGNENKMCEQGREFFVAYRNKDPETFWKAIKDSHIYLFLAVHSPQTAIRLLMRCVEELLPNDRLPEPLADARAVVINPEATKEEMERQLDAIKSKKETYQRMMHKYYYEVIYDLLRWKLGLVGSIVYSKILIELKTAIILSRKFPPPFKKLLIDFFKKELPYEEWIALHESKNPEALEK